MDQEAVRTPLLWFVGLLRILGAEISLSQGCEFDLGVQFLELTQSGLDVLIEVLRSLVVEQFPVEAGLILGIGRRWDEFVVKRETHDPTHVCDTLSVARLSGSVKLR
ncbi:hypothetical protein [Mycobacterium sp. SMC-13]|uniref:hypothetical protein n=1 Tax=Mycobacterium sp. SMC-13 TaxID=3381626 RepID=UPI003877853E